MRIYDEDFLVDLMHRHSREIWVRAIAISKEGNPLYSLEGKTTGGSVNIDGASAIRRTCSLTFIPTEGMEDIRNFQWGLNTRFTLEIGLTNVDKKIMKKIKTNLFVDGVQYYLKINSGFQPISCTKNMFEEYKRQGLLYIEVETKGQDEQIIWFPQGTYVCTSFNSTINTNNYSVSISGKDKMCLLNGEIGGNITSSVDFGQLETIEISYIPIKLTVENYEYNKYYIQQGTDYILSNLAFSDNTVYYEKQQMNVKEKLPLKEIITNLLVVYAEEDVSNIIITDLDEAGVELLQYRGENPMYLFYDSTSQEILHWVLGKAALEIQYPVWDEPDILYTCDKIPYYNSLIEQVSTRPTYINYGGKRCSVIKIEKGEAVGYKFTQLVYAGDLIANQGETIVSVLDKIKNMLGDFEYFYDEEGRFIFQRKKTYINQSWNNIVSDGNGEQYIEDAAYTSAVAFTFEDSDLITAFTNSPQINNIKNDFSIWGKRESPSGADIPIHYRYAIDIKPTHYTTIGIAENTYDRYGKYVEPVESMTFDTFGNAYKPIDKTIRYSDYTELKELKVDDYKPNTYYLLKENQYEKIVYDREKGVVPEFGVAITPSLSGAISYKAEYYSPYNSDGEYFIHKLKANARYLTQNEILNSQEIQNKTYDYSLLNQYSTGENRWMELVTYPISEEKWFPEQDIIYDYYYGLDKNTGLPPISRFSDYVNNGRFNAFELIPPENAISTLKIVTYDFDTGEEIIVSETTYDFWNVLTEYQEMGYDNINQKNWWFKGWQDQDWIHVQDRNHFDLLLNRKNILKFPYAVKVWEKGMKIEGTLITSKIELENAIKSGKRIGIKNISLNEDYYYWNEDLQVYENVKTEGIKSWEELIYKYGKDFYIKSGTGMAYDWREIIYRMADDYFKYYDRLSDFETRLKTFNPHLYNGKTGYEKYYTDMQAFWRQLYNPDLEKVEYKEISFDENFNPNEKYYYLNDETGRYELIDNLIFTRELEVTLENEGAYPPSISLDGKILNTTNGVEIDSIGVMNTNGQIVPINFYETKKTVAAADFELATVTQAYNDDPDWMNKLGLIGSRNTLLENSEFVKCSVPEEEDAEENRKITVNFIQTYDNLEKADKYEAVVKQDTEIVQQSGWTKNWKPIPQAKDENGTEIFVNFPTWILIKSAKNQEEQINNQDSTSKEINSWDTTAFINTIIKPDREFCIVFSGENPDSERIIYKGTFENFQQIQGDNSRYYTPTEVLVRFLGYQVKYNNFKIYYRDSKEQKWIPIEVENAVTEIFENSFSSVPSYGFDTTWAYAVVSTQVLNERLKGIAEEEKQSIINDMIDNAANDPAVLAVGSEGNNFSLETFNKIAYTSWMGLVSIYCKQPLVINTEGNKIENELVKVPAPYYTRAKLNHEYENNKEQDKYLRFRNQEEYNNFEGEVYNVPYLYDFLGQRYEVTENNYSKNMVLNPIQVNVGTDNIPDWSDSQIDKWVTIINPYNNSWQQFVLIKNNDDYVNAINNNKLFKMSDSGYSLLNLTQKETVKTEIFEDKFIYKMNYQFYPKKNYYYTGRKRIPYQELYQAISQEENLYYKELKDNGKMTWQEYEGNNNIQNLTGYEYIKIENPLEYYPLDLSIKEDKDLLKFRKNKYYIYFNNPSRYILIENEKDFEKYKEQDLIIYTSQYNEDYRWISNSEVKNTDFSLNTYYYHNTSLYQYKLITTEDEFKEKHAENNLYLCNYSWYAVDETTTYIPNKYYKQVSICETYRYNPITTAEEFYKECKRGGVYIQNFSGYAIYGEHQENEWELIPPNWQYWVNTEALEKTYEDDHIYRFKFTNDLQVKQTFSLCYIKNMEQSLLDTINNYINTSGPIPMRFVLNGYTPKTENTINGQITKVYWYSQNRNIAAFVIDTKPLPEGSRYVVEPLSPEGYRKGTSAWEENGNYLTFVKEVNLNHVKPFYTLGENSKDYDFSTFWNYNVTENPAVLNFWIDFMDGQSEYGKYSISVIGDRTKVVNDDKIKSIYLKGIPNILLATSNEKEDKVVREYYETQTGYQILTLPDEAENCFAISARSKTAHEELEALLYQHLNMIENINLTCLPVYYLKPNTRIMVRSDEVGISDEYIITKISLPLTYNGTSNISASKVINRLY